MLKLKSLINVLLILTILFCLHPINSSIAGDCDTKGSGAGTPTVTGNYIYPLGYDCLGDPSMEYDTVNSVETINTGGSANLFVIGDNAPFTWSVSNQGFWLDADHTVKTLETEGLTATLYADGTACGTVVIKVTGCDGQEVSGYVRCTAGKWIQTDFCGSSACGNCGVRGTVGKFKYHEQWCAPFPNWNCEDHCPTGESSCESHLSFEGSDCQVVFGLKACFLCYTYTCEWVCPSIPGTGCPF